MNPNRVQACKVVAFDKVLTIPKDDNPMSRLHPPTATDASILDHQEVQLPISKEDLKLLDSLPDRTEPMDDNKAK